MTMQIQPPFITIVSGLPRSGTSLMMQMLTAGGIPPMTDQQRVADDDNPRGYFELEKVKQLRQDKSWVPVARGKVVKIIHLLLMELPSDQEYRVVFMQRDLSEVTKSQAVMLERSGKAGAAMSADKLAAIYAAQLATVSKWLAERPCFKVLEVRYAELIADPANHAKSINIFFGGSLDESAMIAVVDPKLYRNRTTS